MSTSTQRQRTDDTPEGVSANPDPSPSTAHPGLFRIEVMQAHSSQWLGSIRLAQPLSIRIIAALALVVAMAIVSFIFLGSVTRKARVTGLTLPANGTLTIAAMNAGTLARSFVTEGQNVEAGQPLFEISTERQGSNGELSTLVAQQLAIQKETLASERRTRIAQHRKKMSAIDERVSSAGAELIQLDHEIALAQRRLALAKTSFDKSRTLQRSGFVSGAQTQQRQEDLIDLRLRASTLTRAKLQVQSSRTALVAEKNSMNGELDNLLGQLERSDASLNREIAENQQRKLSLIVAPQTGVISTVTYRSGQTVTAGQTVAALIPQALATQHADALEVQLYAPSRMMGFVAVGQTVLIRYQAYPYQKFGLHAGRIIDISKTPFAPHDLPPHLASTILGNAQQAVQGGSGSGALFRMRVKLARQDIDVYGRPQQLRPEMTLDADIVLDRRQIWEWIAAPVIAAGKR